MRTDDILALCHHPRAGHWGAFERRSAVIGAIFSAFVIGSALVNAYAPTAQAFAPNTAETELSSFPKTLDSSGGLPILF